MSELEELKARREELERSRDAFAASGPKEAWRVASKQLAEVTHAIERRESSDPLQQQAEAAREATKLGDPASVEEIAKEKLRTFTYGGF